MRCLRRRRLRAWRGSLGLRVLRERRFVDLPASNVYYPAAALAVSAGAMHAQDGDRFATTRPATGADVLAAIARLEQIAGR